MAKDKKIEFSEEIDSIINGLSVGVAFVIIALFIWFGHLFHNKTIETIISIAMLILGIGETFIEVEKANKEIKGFGNFGLGAVFTALSVFVIIKYNNAILNVFFLFILLLGIYGVVNGVLKIIYSMKWQKRKTQNKKIEILQIVTGATEVIALIVVILELINEAT